MTTTTMTRTEQFTLDSPIGPLDVAVVDGRLRKIAFDGTGAVDEHAAGRSEVGRRLLAYFAGELDVLDDVDVDLAGTPFQRSVWEVLRAIPAGETRSYLEVAEAVGRPTSSRAVGNAVGSNPVPVVVPCHRVITSAGTLGGFGGGLDRKRWLLAHEAPGAPGTLL
ncbi:MAG TPA: methylated-DNA--[protein]-cysteine S-methyltransferase [Acidimicrobiia bacterium]